MSAKKADPDRLLVPIFRAFSNHLGIGNRELRITDESAKLFVHIKDSHYYETIQPDELVEAGVITTADADNYGGHAANRARDALGRLGVKEAIERTITDELPIIYREQGRPYKIKNVGPNPWVFYWNTDSEQWTSIRPATMAEIKAASYARVEDDEAEHYNHLHNSGQRRTQTNAGPGRRGVPIAKGPQHAIKQTDAFTDNSPLETSPNDEIPY